MQEISICNFELFVTRVGQFLRIFYEMFAISISIHKYWCSLKLYIYLIHLTFSVPAQNISVFINGRRGWHNTACKYYLKIYMYWISTSYISYKYRHLPMYRANLVMRSCASSKVQCNLCRHFRLSSPVVIGFSSNFLRHNSIKWQNLLWCFFCCKTLSLYCESEYLDSTEWSVDLVLLQKAINHFLPLCLKMI